MPERVLHHTAQKLDASIATMLVASPAWASWLGSFNALLTTVTLLCGAALGAARLWLFVKRLREERKQ